MTLAKGAVEMSRELSQDLKARMRDLTGLENPNSTAQLGLWLREHGVDMDSLGKKEVATVIDETDDPIIKEVLQLRLQSAKSSVKKYETMLRATCSDGRARGMFQFYGAMRTGRFAGRLLQLQNLPQNHIDNIELVRELARRGDLDALSMMFDSVPDILSQLIRTAFVAREGSRFIVADFSAIEARVIAWLAGEEWRMKAFAEGKDIYCASASAMFGVPVVKHGINGELRQKGKVAELACIAEGQLVLTNHGKKPIETVTTDDLVWDGEQWVTHEGVIYKGIRTVYTYQGLTATLDHQVFINDSSKPVMLQEAVAYRKDLKDATQEKKEIDKRKECSVATTKVYDIMNAGPHHRYTVSGKLVHNCGYGGSVGALKAFGADKMGLTETEMQSIVDNWRASSPRIVQLWWDVDRAIRQTLEDGTTHRTHGLMFSLQKGILFIRLPSGRSLAYVRPRLIDGKITYEGVSSNKGWARLESYGPKFVENCLAEGTQVLTDRGWIEIQNVTTKDALWDGEQWVSHEGLINKGIQEVINIDGALMTPDHKVLTKDGWKTASSCSGLEKLGMGDRYLVRKTGLKKQVYDLKNAGPNHRFTIKTEAGPMIVHNCVQGISRDLLLNAMKKVGPEARICMHIHDELVIEADSSVKLDDICQKMAQVPEWAEGLLLRADGYETKFYLKD